MDPNENPILGSNSQTPPPKKGKTIEPLNPPNNSGATEAVSLLRNKIDHLYQSEPNAQEELAESESAGRHRSKHQQFMHKLSTSGKSLAEIQTAWHQYYVDLPDNEKHEVWQEFYSEHSRSTQRTQPHPHAARTHEAAPHKPPQRTTTHQTDSRDPAAIKGDVLQTVKRKKGTKKRHAGHSLLFGLAMGGVVALFMLFGFFNERFIAPFVTPSKSVSNTPIIIDPASTAVGPESKVIIPKINVEIPVIFDEKSTDEAAIQRALEEGVIHYATTSNPGEQGNGAIFGHSSNNILNKGKYKFAFVLLNRLDSGDLFYVQKDGKRYAYRVYKKTVVSPSQVDVLNVQDKPSTMTLITCDPPGTSINRLVVVGEQISPDPSGNVARAPSTDATTTKTLPSNAPTLWSRLTSWLSS